jgi:hypothetical protein
VSDQISHAYVKQQTRPEYFCILIFTLPDEKGAHKAFQTARCPALSEHNLLLIFSFTIISKRLNHVTLSKDLLPVFMLPFCSACCTKGCNTCSLLPALTSRPTSLVTNKASVFPSIIYTARLPSTERPTVARVLCLAVTTVTQLARPDLSTWTACLMISFADNRRLYLNNQTEGYGQTPADFCTMPLEVNLQYSEPWLACGRQVTHR